MNPEDRTKLDTRVRTAGELALARQGYVSAIDVLRGMGWLDPTTHKRWTLGQVPFLEAGIQTHPSRVSEAMRLFRAWAAERNLLESETVYVARTPDRPPLRFSESGDSERERAYRTRWVSPHLTVKERERAAEKANRPPELVVIQPSKDWTCHRCGQSGDLLIMEPPGPACLRCAGLDDLEFLPSGDAALTRKAKTASTKYAVVVRFSRARKRYERRGLLVEPAALRSAEREIEERAN